MASDLTVELAPRRTPFRMLATSFRPRRAAVATLLLIALAAPGELGSVTRLMAVDAYLQVSVFVAATLALFYGAERLFGFNLGAVLRRSGLLSVPVAAVLGAMPGCGGAIVVVAAYSSGNVGFGAVVAALTATMGDAAFLLIATRPEAALIVLPASLIAGVAAGWTVNRWFPKLGELGSCKSSALPSPVGQIRWKDLAYLALAIPGFLIGSLILLQVASTEMLEPAASAIALLGTALGLVIWSSSSLANMSSPQDNPVTRVAEETGFISVWVLGVFLAYEYLSVFAGLNLGLLFGSVAPLLPLIGILIGFIPGCGPQVLVTAMFINGAIPFAAVLGNAISNDGDALFPAIAVNPRAAVLATVVSALPAALLAYGFFFFAPDFMN